MNLKKASIKSLAISCLLTLGAATAVPAVAGNILINGSFENNAVTPNNWEVFAPSAVDGWDGGNIEIWNNYSGVMAADGNQYAELNAHPAQGGPFTLFQDFATVVGQEYQVTFAYRARSNDNEAFYFEVGTLAQILIDDHVTNAWTTHSTSFIADATTSRIAFSTLDGSTLGNFVDNVSVSAVPAPATLGLLGTGLVALCAARRRGSLDG